MPVAKLATFPFDMCSQNRYITVWNRRPRSSKLSAAPRGWQRLLASIAPASRTGCARRPWEERAAGSRKATTLRSSARQGNRGKTSQRKACSRRTITKAEPPHDLAMQSLACRGLFRLCRRVLSVCLRTVATGRCNRPVDGFCEDPSREAAKRFVKEGLEPTQWKDRI
jgi:hypothetical protein